VAPPILLVTQIWEAQMAGLTALIPENILNASTGGVHGEHDLVLHRPIVLGEPLQIWVEGQACRPAGHNSLVTLRYTAIGADDDVVAEQWWTTMFLGATCNSAGERPPDHTFPDQARQRQRGSYVMDVDADMARRYAGVSGDWSPHHFNVEAAHRSGFPRAFLHGLCTMTLCAQAVVELVADGDPGRLKRIGVRFAAPTFLGEQLNIRLYEVGALEYAFEADAAGTAVITHGRAQLR
jgi:acyl dehydratase